MALASTDEEPMRSAMTFGYAIKMMCGDQVVPVRITDEALDALAYPPDHSSERLREYRSQIEEIASRKHDAGQIESDGSVWVRSEDV